MQNKARSLFGKVNAKMPDLSTTEDITKFMEDFYAVLLADPVAAPVFEGVDMQAHMPRVVAFWGNMIFGGGRYNGSPFERHIPLDLTTEHFVIWYEAFCTTLDALFVGPNATMLRQRAYSIAFIFSQKLGLEPPAI